MGNNLFAIIQAALAFDNVITKWEAVLDGKEDALLDYGTAVDLLLKLAPKDMLLDGYMHRGWIVSVDSNVPGMPVRLDRMQ